MPVCPCSCERVTTRLFAPGHDARYKSYLRSTYTSTPDTSTPVLWGTTSISMDEALLRINDMTGSDWLPYVTKGQPVIRTGRPRPVSSPSTSDTTATPVRPRTPRPQNSRKERIDRLMDRLDQRGPVVGNWGWYRPPSPPRTRLPARVQRTYRDNGQPTIDLFIPAALPDVLDVIVTGISPDAFFPDPMAKP